MCSDKLYNFYEIFWLWLILALSTIENPIIVASKDDPPYDIIGSGDPTIGRRPRTIDILVAT